MTANGAAIDASRSARRYDIDALRVFAFSLLILYHVGMFYVAEWEWHVKSAYQAEWLQLPMSFTNQWRMPLLFVISGLAISFAHGRYSPWRLAGRRAFRLLLPLVFGMMIVVAPQPYYEALSKGIIEPGFLRFMGQYLAMQDFPGEAWGGENIITWTWNHLWYLPYLLFYTLVLILMSALFGGKLRRLRERVQQLGGTWIVVLPVVPLMLYGNFVFPHFPGITHALLDDWYAHAMYFTFFFYGYLFGTSPDLWQTLAGMRKTLVGAGIALFALIMLQRNVLGDDPGFLVEQANFLTIYLNRWVWILALLAWGYHSFNRPMRWLPYATQAVYPWYILHQTITVTVGYQLSQQALGPVLEPALVLLATIGGCFLLYEFVIRRVRVLRPLFGVSY